MISRPTSSLARALAAILLFSMVIAGSSRALAGGEGKAYFESGVRHYNLGHFQEAITDFEKAYNQDPAPILLFNIAQSHRQLGDKERALFFYRRYLEQAPNAGNKAEVEQRMKDLTQSLQQEKDLKQKPPPGVETGDHPPPKVDPPPPPPPPIVEHPAADAGARPWAAEAYLAPSFIGFSAHQAVDAPVMVSLRAGGSYAFPFGPSSVRVGAEGLAAFLPYTSTNTMATKESSSLWGFMLTGRYLYQVAPGFMVGGGVGAGVIWWGGLGADNPFTLQGTAASAPIPMPSLEIGVRAEYLFASGMFVALSPELLLSKTIGNDALSQSISSVHRFDVFAGAGYRF